LEPTEKRHESQLADAMGGPRFNLTSLNRHERRCTRWGALGIFVNPTNPTNPTITISTHLTMGDRRSVVPYPSTQAMMILGFMGVGAITYLVADLYWDRTAFLFS
jgi:hypothetical protein